MGAISEILQKIGGLAFSRLALKFEIFYSLLDPLFSAEAPPALRVALGLVLGAIRSKIMVSTVVSLLRELEHLRKNGEDWKDFFSLLGMRN
jgi:hypothetical protein